MAKAKRYSVEQIQAAQKKLRALSAKKSGKTKNEVVELLAADVRKAVQEGHVYCTSKNLYQSTMSLGTITSDIRRMLTGDDADLTYIYKLE